MELVANFTLNNESLDAEFDINEVNFDALFQIDGGAIWGSIGGDIQNQTDLIELVNNKLDDIEGSALIGVNRTGNTVIITSKTFVFEQAIASDEWVIVHNLNKRPSITVVDTADNIVEGAEEYIDDNTIKVTFNGSFKGKAYLN